ncbi:MAG: phosphatidylglycerol lysyltransferase domain-containing protein [Candidatus Saccharimonadales bacterium]
MPPTFPVFAPLTLDDKEIYENLIFEYPPFSNISFTGMQLWWNEEGKLAISSLNENIIINYYQPYDKNNSGLSIIGKNNLVHTIKEIFRYLKNKDEDVKLVHVPKFVIDKIYDKSDFEIIEEEDYNEYILDSKALAMLNDSSHGKTRRKVNRFLREVEQRKIEIKPLDLSSLETQDKLFQAIIAWEKTGNSNNDPSHTEHTALKKSLKYHTVLDINHLGLYVDDKLCAVILFHRPLKSNYYIINHLKVDYSIPYIFDYMTQSIAKKAVEDGIDFLNMEMDLGIESLRNHKLGLRPVDFFRQYSIKPNN